MTGSVVIVGAGQAGAVAARTLRRKGFSGAVHLVGAEPHLPYQRPPLSKEYLAEGDDDGLFLLDEARCAKLDLDLHLGVRAERIRPAAGAVELADGTSLRADAVVLATGGRPRRLPGVEGERVHHLRTVEDADRLRAALQPGARIVVIGAGFIGSEVASAARARGAEVTVIEALAAPLLRVVGARVGAACAELAARAGVSVRLGESVTSVEEGAGEVVVTTSGGRYAADAVVVGIGIEPDLDVARASGLAVDNGVLVDEHCRSSVPQVYAVGDIANHQHPLFGERIRVEHFDNASKQAAAAASTIAGRPVAASDPHWFWSDQHGANLQHVGHASSWDEMVIRGSLAELEFTAFYLQAGRLRAAFAVDRGEDVAAVRELLAARVPVRPELLADPDVDLAELVAAECPA